MKLAFGHTQSEEGMVQAFRVPVGCSRFGAFSRRAKRLLPVTGETKMLRLQQLGWYREHCFAPISGAEFFYVKNFKGEYINNGTEKIRSE